MTPSLPELLATLDRLEKEATPPVWTTGWMPPPPWGRILQLEREDAEFIVALRNAYPQLRAALEQVVTQKEEEK